MFIWQEFTDPPSRPKRTPRPPSYLLLPPRRPLSSEGGWTLVHWAIVIGWGAAFVGVALGAAGWL